MRRAVGFVLLLALSGLSGCEYARLLRPSVLKQLNPDVVRLVNTLPDMDEPNEATVARLIGHGGLARAEEGADGIFRARIHVPAGQFIWKPAAILVPRGGELELEFHNGDPYSPHAAILPSIDGKQLITLPIHTGGRVHLRLDQPGLYSFDCPIANHAGRGMVGLILVSGEVPSQAKLDRPRQRRPGGRD
jgi:PQQ system protein